eukprot:GHVR01156140.1.p1 GENE.GHVR01156140.1~~GHVR01156140.1.p1  ORF type:complete len:498 (-),score=73.82 GHVR01156140.1:95-1588(-)
MLFRLVIYLVLFVNVIGQKNVYNHVKSKLLNTSIILEPIDTYNAFQINLNPSDSHQKHICVFSSQTTHIILKIPHDHSSLNIFLDQNDNGCQPVLPTKELGDEYVCSNVDNSKNIIILTYDPSSHTPSHTSHSVPFVIKEDVYKDVFEGPINCIIGISGVKHDSDENKKMLLYDTAIRYRSVIPPSRTPYGVIYEPSSYDPSKGPPIIYYTYNACTNVIITPKEEIINKSDEIDKIKSEITMHKVFINDNWEFHRLIRTYNRLINKKKQHNKPTHITIEPMHQITYVTELLMMKQIPPVCFGLDEKRDPIKESIRVNPVVIWRAITLGLLPMRNEVQTESKQQTGVDRVTHKKFINNKTKLLFPAVTDDDIERFWDYCMPELENFELVISFQYNKDKEHVRLKGKLLNINGVQFEFRNNRNDFFDAYQKQSNPWNFDFFQRRLDMYAQIGTKILEYNNIPKPVKEVDYLYYYPNLYNTYAKDHEFNAIIRQNSDADV